MQFVKMILDFGPLLLFFVANAKWGILTATAVFMVAVIVALLISRIVFGKLPVMPLITAILVMVFGSLTLYLHDDTFIKIKPTILYVMFSSILFVGLRRGRMYLKYLFDEAFELMEEGWRLLTIRWGVFFMVMAILNEFVWRNFSTDSWVSFKVFGFIPLTLIFGLFQVGILHKYQIDEKVVEKSDG